MSTAEKVISKLGRLSPKQQEEVLRLVEQLAERCPANGQPTNPIGLWADLHIDLSAEEIDEARREMWGGFPREDIV